MAYRYPPTGTPAHEQFQAYTRSASTALVYASLVALLVGLLAGGLNVWQLREQFSGGQGPDFATWRFYAIQFLQSFAIYALMAAILFVGGMIITCLAWFYAALSADFDDLYDDGPTAPAGDLPPPPPDPSEWTRPIGAG